MNTSLFRILQTALRRSHGILNCSPYELGDLLRELPPDQAAGPEGVPSQLLKPSPWQTTDLATLFTNLSNALDYHHYHPEKKRLMGGTTLLPCYSRRTWGPYP